MALEFVVCLRMKERFCFQPTALDGVVVVERRPIVDERGWFERLFCARELESLTGGKPIVQINRSLTQRRGAVRGLHPDRPWGPGNNPKTAVLEYLKSHPEFEIDRDIQHKLLITVAPDGFLRRLKGEHDGK